MARFLSSISRKLELPSPFKPAHTLYAVSLLAVLVRLALFVINEPYREGDTQILVGSVKTIRACLGEGRLLGCSFDIPFPLLQYGPSIVLSYLGFSDASILHFLAYLSFFGFVASIALVFWTLKRKASRTVAAAGALLMLTGPLLWYSHSTYSEMLAAFLILAFTAASLFRVDNRFLIPLFFLAGMTKEVAFPFLLVIGGLCLLPEILTAPGKIKGRLYALLAGAALTVLVNVAFNYFRYGTYYDAGHLTELYLVPSFRLHLSFFLAMWFTPYGGLLFFWPSFVLLYFSLLVLLFIRWKNKSHDELNGEPSARLIFYLPIIIISLVLILLTAGFSRWCTPLGGAAWGPRYILPWIPSVALLLLYFYAREVKVLLSLILSKTYGLAVTSIALVIVSLPQLMVLFGPFVLVKLFDLPQGCPRVPIIEEDVTYYYRCIEAQIWPGKLVLLESFPLALKPSAFAFTIFYCVILVGGCMWIRRRLVEGQPHAEVQGQSNVEAIARAHKAKPLDDIGWTAITGDSAATIVGAAYGPMRHWLWALLFYALLFTIFFSSILFSGHLLLAPGDGVFIYLPNFFTKKALWDTLILAGFPRFADPQVMMWYPPALLFSYLPSGWNAFVLMAFILASLSMYGYVYTVTRSRLSALASGITYGMSGFMMAHLGHTGIIHCAAWLPLIIWSLEMLRRRWNPFWFVCGALAVGFCFLAGQSQIFFYGLLLCVAYAIALGWTAPVGRGRYYLYAALMLSVGIGLAAVQLIPTAQLINQSVRTEFSFAEFVAFSLTPTHLVTFVFPYLFGYSNHPVKPYFGDWNLTELAGYVGLLPLMLAAIGFTSSRRNPLAVFWLAAGCVALLMALGDATPLAQVTYYVPLINRFRAPARHLMELTFAVSVLSGLGLSAIRQGKVEIGLIRKTIFISALSILACLIAVVVFHEQLSALATARAGVARLSVLPWANAAVGIPLLIFLFAAAALLWWCAKPDSSLRTVLLLVVLLLDLSSFGWFYEWRYASPDVSELSQPASAVDYRQALSSTHQRILPVMGINGPRETIRPNTSRLWGIPSATGTNVLRLEKVSRLLSTREGGDVDPSWSEAANRSTDLMAVRYLLTPRGDFISKDGINWLGKDFNLWTGSGCGHESTPSVTFELPQPFKATRVGLVTMLACSTGVPDGMEVGKLSVTDVNGRVQTQSLLAGRDSSEWAYDCSNVPTLQHKRAAIFDSFPAKMFELMCMGHHYVTTVGLGEPASIKSVQVQWTGNEGGIVVHKISLIDDATGDSYAFNPDYMDNSHFRLVDETAQTRVYENLRAMPRAWLAREALALPLPEEALQAIRTSKLPDGRDFDPARTVLVEEPLSLGTPPEQQTDSNSSADIASLSETVMEVRTRSSAPSVLVTSDPFYPGWEASIDGQPARLFRADYALRGVVLPAGEHLVRFEFRPKSFYYGAIISLLSLAALFVIFFKGVIDGRRRQVLPH
jgi:hypothetical protein